MDDLGINIVVEAEAPKPVNKKAKKRNKYESRRQRAARSKERRNAQSLDRPSKGQQSAQTFEDKNEIIKSQNDSNKLDEEIEKSEIATKKDKPSAEANKATSELSLGMVSSTNVASPCDSEKAGERTTSRLKGRTKESSIEVDEDHAKYMAEFHARPLELDRRSGVVKKNVIKSKKSKHLFTEESEWKSLNLHQRLISALNSNRFLLKQPTVIQSHSIRAFFAPKQNHNLLIQSETGSGKTLAYALPILQRMTVNSDGEAIKVDRSKAGTRCIVLCPTRELAAQTVAVLESLCANSFGWLVPGSLLGEERRKSEKARIRKGISILVATPGRLLDHLTRTEALLMSLKGKLEWLVMDEADRLLDMGLGEQVKQIVQRLRANQPGSGRDGVTWRSVLVSATVTPSVEKLAKDTMIGGDGSWNWVKGSASNGGADKDDKINSAESNSMQLAESTPRQLAQFYVTVTAKLRLSTLVAFLAERVKKKERCVVFMSTCNSVDFHYSLFNSMISIFDDDDDDDDDDESKGIFGRRCALHKLHGNVQHGERQQVMKKFSPSKSKGGPKKAALLLATDVAARGLNLQDVDWTIQYDPPCEVADYAHRAGRVARAGKAGHSLLFLLPSERLFLDILKKQGIAKLTALSLASTLNHAADICIKLKEEGERRSGGGLGQGRAPKASRKGEAFCAEIQCRMEACVANNGTTGTSDDVGEDRFSKGKRHKKGKKEEEITLDGLAQNAFLSHLRAYPTKEKSIRHVFSARALHLGHIARSFALREPPNKLASKSKKSKSLENRDKENGKRNAALAFEDMEMFDIEDQESSRKQNKKRRNENEMPTRSGRDTLLANAAKLQSSGLETF